MKVDICKELNLSPICLGTHWMGEKGTEQISLDVLDMYYDAGGRFLDTGNLYGRWLPEKENCSEQTIAKWLKLRGHRDVVVATKGCHYDLDTLQSRVTADDIEYDIESSLKTLGVDCLDMWYFHRDDTSLDIGDVIELAEKYVKEGKIRYYAASNFITSRMRESEIYADKHNINGFVALSNQHSLATPNAGFNYDTDPTLIICDENDIQYHRESGMPLIAFQSTARGYFAKRAEGKSELLKNSFDNPKNDKTFEELKKLSEITGESIQTLTITELAKSESSFPLIPIVGARSPEQMKDVARALEILQK